MISRRTAMATGVAACRGRRCRAPAAATDKTVKIGNTMPYSGPASTYGVIGRTESRVLQDGQRAGRRRRPHDRFHLAR